MTLLPLPLEFARKMSEYAEVIGPWVFPEEWEEEEEEEEEIIKSVAREGEEAIHEEIEEEKGVL